MCLASKTFLGEVTEWPIVQHWKCCVRVTGPGVRIPLSPLKCPAYAGHFFCRSGFNLTGRVRGDNQIVVSGVSEEAVGESVGPVFLVSLKPVETCPGWPDEGHE